MHILNHQHQFGTIQDTINLTMTTKNEHARTVGNHTKYKIINSQIYWGKETMSIKSAI
jgi:hypothetical protein